MSSTPLRTRSVVHDELHRLVGTNLDPKLYPLAVEVLSDTDFWEAPASIRNHHNYDGGLAEHTLEVLEGVLDLADRNEALDRNALVLGALFHDWGKTETYEKRVSPPMEHDGEPVPASTYWWKSAADELEGHIVIGYARFKAEVAKLEAVTPGFHHVALEKVPSMLLSHHGRTDWGSPIEPQFAEAWALHLADMASVWVICNRA